MNSAPANQPGVNDGSSVVGIAGGSGLDLRSGKFSLANARELALYARMAYDEPPTIQDKSTDTQILIRDLGDCVIVAFRGTTNLIDFITDAECWRDVTSCGEVHHGFWNAYYSVKDALYAALRPFNFKPVLCLGHSLGGALSQIGACFLRQWLVNVHSVYTFGTPRWGNAEMQRFYNALPVPGSPFDNLGDATFSVINDCDIVPRTPGYFVGGYRRPGHDEFIPESGQRIYQDPSVLFRLDSDLIALAQKAWGKHVSFDFLNELLADHHINNYIAALNAREVQS